MARPREFDPEVAMRSITETFWEKGYEGTGLSDLMEATGLKKGSLYAAFGDKRAMYRAALAHYDREDTAKLIRLLRQPGTPFERLHRLFTEVVETAGTPAAARGCLICNAAIDQAPVDEKTRLAIGERVARIEDLIFACLEQTLGSDDRRREKAKGLISSYFGMRVLAKAGADKSYLCAVRDDALAVLKPSS